MSNISTPDNWDWYITPKQIEEIKQCNRKTINDVYFDNCSRFARIARKFCVEHHKQSDYEDCLQQIYIDLPLYNFSNKSTLYRSILNTLRRVSFSKFSVLSYDMPIHTKKEGNREMFLADLVGAYDKYDIENDVELRKVVDIVSAQTQLSSVQKDILIAYALGCEVYRGLYEQARTQVSAV